MMYAWSICRVCCQAAVHLVPPRPGARVVVESPDGADFLRHAPPLDERARGWFSSLHAGKESVALNLKIPSHRGLLAPDRGRCAHRELPPWGNGAARLDPNDLRRRFPTLVICSLTGFGQDGPQKDRPGHDLGFQALAGALSMAARRDGVVDVPGVQIADVGGGALTAALRIVAALLERTKTGQGTWLDVAMVEGTLAMVAPHFAAAAVAGRRPRRVRRC